MSVYFVNTKPTPLIYIGLWRTEDGDTMAALCQNRICNRATMSMFRMNLPRPQQINAVRTMTHIALGQTVSNSIAWNTIPILIMPGQATRVPNSLQGAPPQYSVVMPNPQL